MPAATPLFLGAEPRVVPAGEPDAGAAVLGEEEAAARALLAALPEPLRARATLPYADGRGLMLGQVRRVALAEGVGVARGEAPPEAQAQFDRLLDHFADLFARRDRGRAPRRDRRRRPRRAPLRVGRGARAAGRLLLAAPGPAHA